MRIYIAGPYRSDKRQGVEKNIAQARDAMAVLLKAGHTPFCPHSMTAHFELLFPEIDDSVYLALGLDWLKLCNAVVLLPGWEDSEGSLVEREVATYLGIPIYIWPEMPEANYDTARVGRSRR